MLSSLDSIHNYYFKINDTKRAKNLALNSVRRHEMEIKFLQETLKSKEDMLNEHSSIVNQLNDYKNKLEKKEIAGEGQQAIISR